MKRKRKTRMESVRPVGEGGDGNQWGVTSLVSSGGAFAHRPKPCATCPWRRDSPVGFFPPDAYRESACTAEDASMRTFACHESGPEKPATCAGFLLRNAENNLGIRIALASGRFDPTKVGNPDGVPLYDSYREMAEANGVSADDPALALTRANDD